MNQEPKLPVQTVLFDKNNHPPDGFDYSSGCAFIVNKPSHWTSFRVVGLIRKLTGIKKVGHAGTLDPLATGVLILCVGKATKQIDLFMASKKSYITTITLGSTTPSYDSETEISETAPFDHVTVDAVKKLIQKEFIGPIEQIPPMYSAVKHKGTPLYKMARVGKTIERKVRFVEIEKCELLKFDPPDIKLDITCSKGTYIRTIAYDLGIKLGTVSYMTALERTASGDYTVDQAFDISTLIKVLDPNGKSGISI
ncbi:MAG TPA: tRNA pseudouridine(55) synthase TruB [Bacteroidetes bacterium]|nr:tRNA pseudouridine(55) synthase TruB [Bacteroidota bacterium]